MLSARTACCVLWQVGEWSSWRSWRLAGTSSKSWWRAISSWSRTRCGGRKGEMRESWGPNEGTGEGGKTWYIIMSIWHSHTYMHTHAHNRWKWCVQRWRLKFMHSPKSWRSLHPAGTSWSPKVTCWRREGRREAVLWHPSRRGGLSLTSLWPQERNSGGHFFIFVVFDTLMFVNECTYTHILRACIYTSTGQTVSTSVSLHLNSLCLKNSRKTSPNMRVCGHCMESSLVAWTACVRRTGYLSGMVPEKRTVEASYLIANCPL